MKTTARLCYRSYGSPEEVIELETSGSQEPAPGQVAVRVLASPINPADINMIEGKYGEQRPLPDVPGNEGVGVVESAPGGEFSEGTRVLLLGKSWCSRGVWPAADLIALPGEPRDPLQAAMLRINPPTAWAMLESFRRLQPGDRVLQNAANSGVGRWVIALCKRRGIETINVVRRKELVHELTGLGATTVLVDNEQLRERVLDAAAGAPIPLALNAVGGEVVSTMAKCVSPGGCVVTYGAMGRQPVKLSAGLLIFKELQFSGFWVSKWIHRISKDEAKRMFSEIFEISESGENLIPIAATYPLEEHAQALSHSQSGARGGKILFVPQRLIA